MTSTVAKCLICFTSQLDNKNKCFESSQLLNSQLNVIFVLENILELKPSQLQIYLRQWGNPGEWVNLCEKCERDICDLRKIFLKLHDIKRKFEKAKWELQDKIRVQEEERTMAGKQMGIAEIFYDSRSTFLRRRVWKSDYHARNPFNDGDQKAAELALTVEVVKDEPKCMEEETNEVGNLSIEEDGFHDDRISSADFSSTEPVPEFPGLRVANEPVALSNDNLRSNRKTDTSPSNITRRVLKKARNTASLNKAKVASDDHSEAPSAKLQKAGKRQMNCPICKTPPSVNSIISFGEHFNGCLNMSTAPGTDISLRCSLCKFSCSSAKNDNGKEFMEHVVLCQDRVSSKRIPWRHALVKCNLCEGSKSAYLPFPDYIKHVFNYHQHRYGCSECPYRAHNSTIISGKHWPYHHKELLETPNTERYKVSPEGTVMPLPQIPWWCPASKCFQEFPDEASRDLHLKNCNESDTLERSFKCSYCNQGYYSEEELQMHRVCVHGRFTADAPKCEECDLIFNTRKTLKFHQRKMHKLDTFKCLECGAEFHCNYDYNGHKRLEHGIEEELKDYTCHICGKVFSHKSKLRTHIASAHADTNLKCFDCGGLEFDDKEALANHMSLEHQLPRRRKRSQKELNAIFCCTWESCGKQYKTSSALKLHVRYFHKETDQEHICDVCGKSFGKPWLLQSHIKNVHEKYLPFPCDVCGKGCHQKRDLLNHKANVHGIGFKCEVDGCLKVLATQELLNDHSKYKHEGVQEVKPFSCQFCGKGFYQERKVRQHEQAMHTNRDSKPFKCTLPSCEKRFSTQHYLNCHLRYTHKIERKNKLI